MFRTPTFLTAVRDVVLLLALNCCLPSLTKADLGVSILTHQDGDLLTADVTVSNFEDITSIQFALSWDPTELEFVSVGNFNMPTMTSEYFGTTQVDLGYLRFLWYHDGAGLDLTLPDCTPIYRVTYKVLGSQFSPIQVNPDVMVVEAVNKFEVEVPVVLGSFCTNMAYITGNVFNDGNGNCTSDPSDTPLEGCMVRFAQEGATYFCHINPNGKYFMLCPTGTWNLSTLTPEAGSFATCQDNYTLAALESQVYEQDMGVQELASNADDASANVHFSVFPNPAQAGQSVWLAATGQIGNELTIQLYDLNGKCLSQWEQPLTNSPNEMVNMPALSQGVYFVRLVNGGSDSKAMKLVVH